MHYFHFTRNDHPTAHVLPAAQAPECLAPGLTLPQVPKTSPAAAQVPARAINDMSRDRQTWHDGFGCFDA